MKRRKLDLEPMLYSKSKLIVRIFGGLGNQLFIYAAARRMALVNQVELVIDDVSGFTYDTVYRRHYQLDNYSIPCRKATPSERLEPFSRVRRAIKRRLNQFLPFERRRYLIQEGFGYDSRLLGFKPIASTYIEGYWQSEKYFVDQQSAIRNDLRFKSPLSKIDLSTAECIQNCRAVSVHVRFFDGPLTQGVNNISSTYYSRALEVMEKRVPEAHYFIFSDQPEAAMNLLKIPMNRVTLVSHNKGDVNASADLWLMNQCQNHIIANSTFSWWGAWLGVNRERIVIAPASQIIGLEKKPGSSNELYPPGWVLV